MQTQSEEARAKKSTKVQHGLGLERVHSSNCQVIKAGARSGEGKGVHLNGCKHYF